MSVSVSVYGTSLTKSVSAIELITNEHVYRSINIYKKKKRHVRGIETRETVTGIIQPAQLEVKGTSAISRETMLHLSSVYAR